MRMGSLALSTASCFFWHGLFIPYFMLHWDHIIKNMSTRILLTHEVHRLQSTHTCTALRAIICTKGDFFVTLKPCDRLWLLQGSVYTEEKNARKRQRWKGEKQRVKFSFLDAPCVCAAPLKFMGFLPRRTTSSTEHKNPKTSLVPETQEKHNTLKKLFPK